MHRKLVVLFLVVMTGAAGADMPAAFPQASNDQAAYNPALFSGLRYRNVGPSRGGRVTAVAGIPSQPETFYMGSTGGGVWKTTDCGQTWRNVSDGYFATGSIGAIRIALSDPNIIYVGTGSEAIRSNVIKGLGVYKSVDAGKTWTFLGLRDAGQIGAVEIDPRNPDVVFVAAIGQAFGPNAERGVFRSRDGGRTWEKVLFLSDRVGAVDIELSPGNPDTIYASMWRGERKPWTIISGGREGGVYRSTNGGDSWTQVVNGLPTGLRGKSDLAVSAADPNRVYVLMEAPEGEGGLYRSDDRAETFRLISTYASLLDRPFYYCNLDADPTNADVLYVNSTQFFKSTDAGKTWNRLSTPHGDNHDMWINPNNPKLIIQSNDGGANVTRDGCQTWSTQDNQPTAEIYQVAVDDRFPYWLYGGQQDNSTIMVPSLPPYSPAAGPSAFWQSVGGCETGPAVPKPGNPDIVYANCKGCFGRYNKITGEEKLYFVGAANIYGHNPKDLKFRFQRVSPIHVSPHDANVVYHASQYLHKTTDEGVTWETISPDLTANESDKQVISGEPITRDITGEEFYSTIYTIRESPLEKGLIWAGANDGPVHLTRDGGKAWTKVTPPEFPSGGRIQTVEPSPHRPGKAYFAAYRYLLGDWAPYIYRTDDYGKTWKRLTTGKNGIPADFPTRVVREDPDREGLLYAGTEFGMFISFDDGENWQSFQLNLPATPVTDIQITRQDLVLSTMGRSFWILDDLTPLHQLKPEAATAAAILFEPRNAVRMRYGSFGSDPAAPEYLRPGAIVDYYLSAKPPGEIRLEFLRADGSALKTLSSTAKDSPLIADAGMHRLIWDLRIDGGPQGGGRSPRGPLVAPGTYRARLKSGDWSREVDFEITPDPRIAADGVTVSDLKAQEQLSLKVLNLQGEARQLAAMVEAEIKKLAEKGGKGERLSQADQALRTRWNDLHEKMITAKGAYPQPMLIDQISYLAEMLDGADQKPGRDAFVRLGELEKALAERRAEFGRAVKREK